jgi:hypothetical protein
MNSGLVSVSDSGSASSDSYRLCLESPASVCLESPASDCLESPASEVLPFVYVSATRSSLCLESPASEVLAICLRVGYTFGSLAGVSQPQRFLPFVNVSATRLESGEG